MTTDKKISVLIEEAKQGSDMAATALWEAYFPRLRRYASAHLRDNYEDAEDVALSAIKSFLMAAQDGRFPDLNERDDLWRLLSTLTRRKVVDLIRRKTSQKAGGNGDREDVMNEVAITDGLDAVADGRPPQDLAFAFLEQVELLIDQLDDQQQRVAVAKLEGYTNREIAAELGVSHWTVERMLRLIRDKWKRELPS